jgi:amino-acid N-acetyltransferase
MNLRPPQHDEHSQVRALLIESGLPVVDLDKASVDFIIAADDGEAVGVIGLEVFGTVGLLRSLAVEPAARGRGIGGLLVDALERYARGQRLDQLVLLTQTAAPFFANRGYRVIDRGGAPEAVSVSAEFRSICPASAICMTKDLGYSP